MNPEQLARYREAVASDLFGPELEQIAAGLEQAGITVHGHGVLKSAPRGYPADHPRIALLRYKGLTAWQEWPAGAWLESAQAKDRVVLFFRTTEPLRPGSPTTSGADAADRAARLPWLTTGPRAGWDGADGTGCPALPAPAGCRSPAVPFAG